VRADRRQRGQASVELVVLLPVVALVAASLWQAVVAAQAAWLAPSAARAAARAAAIGRDPVAAARGVLPARLEPGLAVAVAPGGAVRVSVPVPLVWGRRNLGLISARAAFARQAP
jgi:hypothetical protein